MADSPPETPYFETSQTTAKLDEALAKAQGEFAVALKDAVNPHFKSKYADLASVWDACRPALAKHGISVTQLPIHSSDGRAHLITRISHGGEWMRSHFSMPVRQQDVHGYKSAITYLKRTCLEAVLGIATEEDDDGNAAQGGGGAGGPNQQQVAAAQKVPAKAAVKAAAKGQPPGSSPVSVTSPAPGKVTSVPRNIQQQAYRIPGGQLKGKFLSECDPRDLAARMNNVIRNAETNQQSLAGQEREFVEQVESYLCSINFHEDDP